MSENTDCTLRMLILVFIYVLPVLHVSASLTMKAVSFPPGISPNLLIFSQLIWQIEVLVSRVSERNSILQRKCFSLGVAVRMAVLLE